MRGPSLPSLPPDTRPLPAATAAETSVDPESAVADYIASRINFERMPTERYALADFRLERMRHLLDRLGNPQHAVPAVHIAGTKGKGSTAAMLAAVLQAAGHQVGLFTSPHIEHLSERMLVNGERPAPTELASLLEQLRPVVDALDAEGASLRPTFFEVLTAMAWLHFRNRRVDICVLETGLGGRLDATNVCNPLVCLITSISRDHERLLGSTLAAIAREKAGIIKPRVPVVSGVTADEPAEEIRQAARDCSSSLLELQRDIHWYHSSAETTGPREDSPLVHLCVDVETPWNSHRNLCVPLPGRHQADNLALAVVAIDLLNRNGWQISDSALTEGLGEVQWPLRGEVIAREPLVVVDAAHNVAAIDALVKTLQPLTSRERVLIFATSRDKDTHGILSRLANDFDRVILTQFVKNPRAVPRQQLEGIATAELPVPWEWVDDPTKAWQRVRETASPDALVCATGSFFLAAEFRAAVQNGLNQ